MQCNIDNLWPLLGIDLVRIHVKSGFGGRCLPRHAPDWVGVLQGSSHDFPLQGWEILMHGIIIFLLCKLCFYSAELAFDLFDHEVRVDCPE